MGILFRNWLEEGYYEEDESGDLTRLTSKSDIKAAAEKGTLYEHDGMGISRASTYKSEDYPDDDDDYGGTIKHFRD